MQRPSDLGFPGSASRPGLGLGWLNNRCRSPRAGPVSLPPLVPPSRALANLLDPGLLLVQPVSTFPARWRPGAGGAGAGAGGGPDGGPCTSGLFLPLPPVLG